MKSFAKRYRFRIVLALAAIFVVAGASVASVAVAGGDSRKISTDLTSFEETPALSTPGVGDFRARISRDGTQLQYELTYSNLESQVTQAHLHFENATNNGPVVVFLCTNLGNGPAGTQTCPAAPATITGTITAAQVGNGAAAQGLAAGEFAELVRAIRAGAIYVNVHSMTWPLGEIRGQLDNGGHDHGHHDDHGRHDW